MNEKQFKIFMDVQQKILEKMAGATTTEVAGTSNQISLTSNTALVPNFDLLDTAKESFRNYKLRFENYTHMQNIHTNKEYCNNWLLNSIGAKNFNIVKL